MKSLIVYYSRTGTTKKVGSKLSSKIGGDLEELMDTKNRKGIVGWLRSGKDGLKESITDIEPISHHPENYDLVVVGTPIWSGSITPAVRTYLQRNGKKMDKTAFFCTSKSGNIEKALKQIETILDTSPISTLSLIEKDVKNKEYSHKIDRFIKEIL